MRRIGVLTSGGDSPGMNAAVMAVAKSARYYGMSLIGIKRGYNGTLCKSHHIEDDMVELDLDTILDIADQPGTYLRTARCLDFLRPQRLYIYMYWNKPGKRLSYRMIVFLSGR